jgi:hypothetical protein
MSCSSEVGLVFQGGRGGGGRAEEEEEEGEVTPSVNENREAVVQLPSVRVVRACRF